MRPIVCLSILLASCAWADQASDRAALGKGVYALNASPPVSDPFTADFRDFADLACLGVAGGAGTVVISREPMGEATWYPEAKLRLVIRSIRFITPEVALVDGVNQQEDTAMKGTPVL